MSVAQMQKVHIISLRHHKDGVLKCLQKNEVVDIQKVSEPQLPGPPGEELGRQEYQLAQITSAISFLESAAHRKKSFIEGFIPPREELSESEFLQACRESDCAAIVKQCLGLEGRLANLKSLRGKMQNEFDRVAPWRKLNVPMNYLAGTQKVCITLGKIKPKQLGDFRRKAEMISPAVEIAVIDRIREALYLMVICLAGQEKDFAGLFSESAFELVSLPLCDKTPSEELSRLRRLLKETDEDLLEVMAEAKKLSRHLPKLKFMHDLILDQEHTLSVKQKLADTEYTFVLEGWVKKEDLARLGTELAKVTTEVELLKLDPAPGERPPVALKNPPALSPFELITRIYGTPRYDELDPSIPLAFFFALFFGICLGDVGYGIVLAAFSIYFMKRYRLPEGGKKLFRLLLLGGAVSCLVGMLTGSYLGFSPKEIPATLLPLKDLLSFIQVVDPIKNPLTMLILSLALGVVQILFGISLQLVHRIMKKEYLAAFLDDGLWIFFLGSLVFLIVANAAYQPGAALAAKLSLAGAAALVLTQGRHQKNIVQKLLSGLLSLYKVSGYMGDVLSYSRLLALGMSTTIIGSVINILAGMVKGGVPVLGYVLMLALLVFGHLFNLIIGTLSAFVHSTRLQMVEFFSKFYEGGGREFRPYRREAEYTVLR